MAQRAEDRHRPGAFVSIACNERSGSSSTGEDMDNVARPLGSNSFALRRRRLRTGAVQAPVRAACSADLDQAAPERRASPMKPNSGIVRRQALFTGHVDDRSIAELDGADHFCVLGLETRQDRANARADVLPQLGLEARLGVALELFVRGLFEPAAAIVVDQSVSKDPVEPGVNV